MIFEDNNSRLRFKLNQTDFTAKITRSDEVKNTVFIPRSITFNSKDYLITSIEDESFSYNLFNITTIEFSKDSEIRSIGPIFPSSIKKLILPPKIEELKEGWCKNTSNLNYIEIPASNQNFKYLDEDHNIIVGKTNPDHDDYDVIVFSNRNLRQFKVPSSITRIGPYSFSYSLIQNLDFEENSKLTIIDHMAFKSCKLEYIKIPASLKILNEYWIDQSYQFYDFQVEISPENPFFKYNDEKTIIYAKSDIKSDNFDIIVKASKNIKKVIIPSYIKHINSFAFAFPELEEVEFESNSKLTYIGESAFYDAHIKKIKIPQSVKFIGKKAFAGAFYCEAIDLPLDSEIKIFRNYFLGMTRVTTLNIPKSVEELEDGWCSNTFNLSEIIISPENKHFKYLDSDRKIIVGKSNQNEEKFDVLHFACRNIEKVSIPSSIEYIKPFAFCFCKKIKEIKFEKNSKLKSIGESAFYISSIEIIEIPSSLELIDDYAFYHSNLNTIIIPDDSQLKSVKNYSFGQTSIESFYFPSKLEEISFSLVKNLTKFSISNENKNFKFLDNNNNIIVCKSNQKNDEFDSILISSRDIKEVFIPSSIKFICSSAFQECKSIEKVEFSKDSQLIKIDNYAFSYSSIKEIKIPSSVEYIGKVFDECQNLKKIEFEENSNLFSFESYLLSSSNIESISIPSKLNIIKNGWCYETKKLKNVFISPENKFFSYLDKEHKLIGTKLNEDDDVFNVLLFACRDVKKVVIPSTIKKISSFCFHFCLIDEIFIPKNVQKIGYSAFENCKRLKKVEFEKNSKLTEIRIRSFSSIKINNFVFPEKVKDVDLNTLYLDDELKSIEFLANELCVKGYVNDNFMIFSFPNALKINVKLIFDRTSDKFVFYTYPNAEIFQNLFKTI